MSFVPKLPAKMLLYRNGFRIKIVFTMKLICARRWLPILRVLIKPVWKCTEHDMLEILLGVKSKADIEEKIEEATNMKVFLLTSL